MELTVTFGILFGLAALAAVVLWLQVAKSRGDASRATGEFEGVRKRLTDLEAEAKKTAETLEAKRREADELKERIKDVKKRRHEEKESARLKQDIEHAREEIEREMEKKLQHAREEAEISKAQVKKLSTEVEALKSRRPERAPEAPKPVVDTRPLEPRYATPEEVKRAEEAEKAAVQARKKVDEAHEEVKKVRARAETDRRVFLVQKGELDVAKDRFRAMEAKFNALFLESENLKKAVWLMEKELKALKPAAEPAAKKEAPKPAEAAAKPAEEPKPAAEAEAKA